ncbi:MAG: Holliday junction resolvase RuvX [Gammaproteobacteria bacterium]|jgi:putative Holliday junction resolvase
MTETLNTVIGFDYGTRWIGVAVGQTLTRQARPLGAVKTGDWEAIERVLHEWKPQRLIVGLPLNMQGEEQEMSKRAERFGRQLEGRFGISTDCIDERLTTREAYTIAVEDGHNRKSKQEIDSLAAALITESWLREHAKT